MLELNRRSDVKVSIEDKERKQEVIMYYDECKDLYIDLVHATPNTTVMIEKKDNPSLYDAFSTISDELRLTHELVENANELTVRKNSLRWNSNCHNSDNSTSNALVISKESEKIELNFLNNSLAFDYYISVKISRKRKESGPYFANFVSFYNSLASVAETKKDNRNLKQLKIERRYS